MPRSRMSQMIIKDPSEYPLATGLRMQKSDIQYSILTKSFDIGMVILDLDSMIFYVVDEYKNNHFLKTIKSDSKELPEYIKVYERSMRYEERREIMTKTQRAIILSQEGGY